MSDNKLMPQIVSATKARNNFAEIVNRVFYRGEEFIVQKKGKPAVLITRVKKKQEEVKRKMTSSEFLLKLATYHFKGGPKDLAKNHDKYVWE